jgi:hypothetical protein
MRRAGSIFFIIGTGLFALLGCQETPIGPAPPKGIPSVVIDEPPLTAGEPRYAKVVRFIWREGEDAAPVATRHLWSSIVDTNGTYNPNFDIIADLNANPDRYENAWSRWIPFDAPGDSGRSTIIGDDEVLQVGRYYLFAVQARDEAGRLTDSFSTQTNARRFTVKSSAIPLLVIYEDYLVGFRFLGTNFNAELRDLPPGIPLHFRWRGDVSDYGGEIAGYRYAWDIPDPAAWDAPFDPGLTAADEVTFYAGVHTLFVETVDIAGTHSLGRVTVNIIPFPMDRELLFVEDYYATDTPVGDYSRPTKAAHLSFWLDICSRAIGFDPVRDVYDCSQNRYVPPGAALIGRYKNLIWTHSAANSAWGSEIIFTPESEVGGKRQLPINYLSIFLLKGGHLWTLGQALGSGGGLAAALPPDARSFPMNLACEITGNRNDCRGDRSGVISMPYRDDCVTVLDRVDGPIRSSPGMPVRKRNHYDCMSYALRADSDPITAAHPGFPGRLDLWEEVTREGRYFDPNDSLGPGGFTYVEVYDPAYWMWRTSVPQQPCFHPLYRMRAVSERSALNGCTVALWITKYGDVVPEVSSGAGVAAPSFHFGFPLWFFERSAVDSIASAIFDEWGILISK